MSSGGVGYRIEAFEISKYRTFEISYYRTCFALHPLAQRTRSTNLQKTLLMLLTIIMIQCKPALRRDPPPSLFFADTGRTLRCTSIKYQNRTNYLVVILSFKYRVTTIVRCIQYYARYEEANRKIHEGSPWL